eukprot:gene9830-biopygen2533
MSPVKTEIVPPCGMSFLQGGADIRSGRHNIGRERLGGVLRLFGDRRSDATTAAVPFPTCPTPVPHLHSIRPPYDGLRCAAVSSRPPLCKDVRAGLGTMIP